MNDKTTCQICARDIKAKTGLIAHHGYMRPYMGGQTSSCDGARHLPYEQSRDLIPTVIAKYKVWQKQLVEAEQNLISNPPATINGRPARNGKSVTYERPADFDAEKNIEYAGYDPYSRAHSWRVYELRRDIKHIKEDIDRLQRRYDAWVPPKEA